MRRRPNQGAEPLPPAPPRGDNPAPPSSTAVHLSLARTLRDVRELLGDDVIKDTAEQLTRVAKKVV